jgi:1-aminocyclopropane-1-carboxylate deaminase/D-cysteine desulfhydrase-like pyridoxal-dependent ACC family enzyme
MQIQWERSTFDSIVYTGRKYIIKRDDLLLPIGGNKARKLYHLSKQDLSKVSSIVSFGGAQSNAMLALSQFCKSKHIRFDYYTRAVPKWLKQKPLGNLAHALDNGMHWHINQPGLPPDDIGENKLLIPQGISMPEAEQGIKKLAEEIEQFCTETSLKDIAVVLPSGTGATALYLQQHLSHTVYTIPCIGNAETLTALFKQLLPDAERYPTILDKAETESFRFGEPHAELLAIYEQLLESTGIEFELLYDAKAWLTLLNWSCDKPIIYIHNGGTSGNASMLARYKRLGMTQ